MDKIQNSVEYKRMLKHIKIPKQFVLIIAEYNDPLYRDRIIKQMSLDNYHCLTINLSDKVNPNISDFENELEKSVNYDIVHLINIHERENDEEFIKYLKGLNLHRDRIAQIAPVNIILWFLNYQTPQLITEAIDFWNWNTGIVSFILKKEHFLGLPFSEVDIWELNLQEKQENLESTINFLLNKKPEEFKSADFMLLEQLIRTRFDINAYEKKYNFLGQKLYEIRENIKKIVDKFDNSGKQPLSYNHQYIINELCQKLQKKIKIDKIQLLNILNNSFNKNNKNKNEKQLFDLFKLKENKINEDKIFKLIYQLLDFKNLNKEEKKYLLYFSILPPFEIKLSDLIIYFGIKDNKKDFEQILNKLSKKGWLIDKSDNAFLMHPLIQTFVRQKLKPNAKNCKELLVKFAELLNYQPHENPHSKMYIIPLIDNLVQFIKEEDKDIARLLNSLSGFYIFKGEYSKALEYQLISVKISEILLEDSNLNLSTAYSNLGEIYRNLGDYNNALEYQLKDIEILEKRSDILDSDLIITYGNIAETYRNLKNYSKVIDFQIKAINLGEKLLDKNDPLLATIYGNIAETFRNLKDFHHSLELHKKSLEIREKVLDKYHPDLSSSYNNLGLTFQDMGNFDQALYFQNKSIEIKEQILGLDHPNLAISYNNIASTYYYLGDLKQANYYIDKAIEIFKKSLTSAHPEFQNSIKWKNIINNKDNEL